MEVVPIKEPPAGQWHKLLSAKHQARFTSIGWSADDWVPLFEEFTERPGGWDALCWLMQPAGPFTVPVTPDDVHEAAGTYDEQDLAWVLTALAAGATRRFVDAYLGSADSRSQKPATAWTHAMADGLTEQEATAWARTGWLGTPAGRKKVTAWTLDHGSGTYLWAAAGFTRKEYATLTPEAKAAAEPNLRVMAALNGVTIPDGL